MKNSIIPATTCCICLCIATGTDAALLDGNPSNEAYFLDFTGLDGSGTDPGDFSVTTAAGEVSLTGSTAGVGNFSSMTPLLYNSGTEAWIAEPGDMLDVVFPTAVSVLEFFAATVDAAEINVMGNVDQAAQVSLMPGEAGIFSFSGAITGFRLTNQSTDPDLDLCNAYCASIDDLGFTPVPVPAAFWLMSAALGLLGLVHRRTRTNGELQC